ncbi:hypothetical protein ACTOB_004732 [Actinoplanes oblitus]|uniref:MmyB-like transcription regulator ligand binding domain-containing protein n=1 Tax=Actinoplanes oblitus TaxID=3040509 RepID=A0ABY8W606_9ACTN|nr:hypothetical protein [Actinoplanes oblitus]WIM92777.1 hypothetical protein ACTOB_004732 [Actinoplanes oblitus]
MQSLLDAMTDAPAFVRNGRLDILAVNALGQALYSPAYAAAARPVNLARFCFLDPAAEGLYADWAEAADTTANLLRTEARRDPADPGLTLTAYSAEAGTPAHDTLRLLASWAATAAGAGAQGVP